MASLFGPGSPHAALIRGRQQEAARRRIAQRAKAAEAAREAAAHQPPGKSRNDDGR